MLGVVACSCAIEVACRIHNETGVGKRAIYAGRKVIKDSYFPTFAHRSEFEGDASLLRASRLSGAVKISSTVEDYVSGRIRSVSSVEGVEHGFVPASAVRRELKYGASSILATVCSRPIKVALAVRGKAGMGIRAVTAAAEVVKHGPGLGVG